MALTRTQKEENIAKIKSILTEYPTIVFVNYSGLSSSEAHAARRELDKSKVGYIVIKKRLLALVLNELGIDTPQLEGQVAMTYGHDELAPASALYRASSEMKLSFKFIGGIIDKQFIQKDRIMTLATIPPREVLLAQCAYMMRAPLHTFGQLLNALSKQK